MTEQDWARNDGSINTRGELELEGRSQARARNSQARSSSRHYCNYFCPVMAQLLPTYSDNEEGWLFIERRVIYRARIE